MPLVDLAVGTEIKFVEAGFQGPAGANANSSSGWRTGHVCVWKNTTSSTIAKGTCINLYYNTSSGPSASVGSCNMILTSCGCGSISSTGVVPPSMATGGGHQFIYQGGNDTGSTSTDWTNNTTTGVFSSSSTPLFMLGWQGSTGLTHFTLSGTIGNATSYLPAELASGDTVWLGSAATNGYYSGPRSGYSTAAAYFAQITNLSNWTTAATTSGTGTYSSSSWSTTTFSFTTTPSFTGATPLRYVKIQLLTALIAT